MSKERSSSRSAPVSTFRCLQHLLQPGSKRFRQSFEPFRVQCLEGKEPERFGQFSFRNIRRIQWMFRSNLLGCENNHEALRPVRPETCQDPPRAVRQTRPFPVRQSRPASLRDAKRCLHPAYSARQPHPREKPTPRRHCHLPWHTAPRPGQARAPRAASAGAPSRSRCSPFPRKLRHTR
jgi:hypothetical protein